MPFVKLPDGSVAHVCMAKQPRKRCSSCGCLTEHDELRECDWKVGDGKTCDRLICVGCSVVPAVDKDLCPEHAAVWKGRTA